MFPVREPGSFQMVTCSIKEGLQPRKPTPSLFLFKPLLGQDPQLPGLGGVSKMGSSQWKKTLPLSGNEIQNYWEASSQRPQPSPPHFHLPLNLSLAIPSHLQFIHFWTPTWGHTPAQTPGPSAELHRSKADGLLHTTRVFSTQTCNKFKKKVHTRYLWQLNKNK